MVNHTMQSTTGVCTSAICLALGWLVEIKDILSAISVLIGIFVGLTVLYINLRTIIRDNNNDD